MGLFYLLNISSSITDKTLSAIFMSWKTTMEILAVDSLPKKVYNYDNIACSEGDKLEGSWDSFNIVDVTRNGNQYSYRLTTTVLL